MKKKRAPVINYLRHHRERIPDLSIQELADKVDESFQNIQRYETMERALHMDVANKIAPLLGLEYGALLFIPPDKISAIFQQKIPASKDGLFHIEEKMTPTEAAGKFVTHVMGSMREMPEKTREKAEGMLREVLKESEVKKTHRSQESA